jgi:hypothetical protein
MNEPINEPMIGHGDCHWARFREVHDGLFQETICAEKRPAYRRKII